MPHKKLNEALDLKLKMAFYQLFLKHIFNSSNVSCFLFCSKEKCQIIYFSKTNLQK